MSLSPSDIKPVCLLILDGFGHSNHREHNAIAQAHKTQWDALWNKFPHTFINASEQYVGLPHGQMGNSEVGHLNIGTGRVVVQDIERINASIANGDFFSHHELLSSLQTLRKTNHALHIIGLLSDGGVHSLQEQIHALLDLVAQQHISQVFVHAFLDGRDTPPKSATRYIEQLEQKIKQLGVAKIASISGRYYGMDRDKRWERVKVAYDLLTDGVAPFVCPSAIQALNLAYERGELDEFVQPTAIRAQDEAPLVMRDGDMVVMMNFRSDRMRQITDALTSSSFVSFQRSRHIALQRCFTLTQYYSEQTAFPLFPPQVIHKALGEYVSSLGLKQLRIAETEKYPHVTFFFNGGIEKAFPNEDRILVPSPKVATYDLQPEMSAFEVTDKLEQAILSRQYALIICNYANADMVGHTGNMPATVRAIEALDACVGRVVQAMQSIGGEVIITADHGNAELMYEALNSQAHTQHTTHLVPFLYIGRHATLSAEGKLSDIAPTLLYLMGLPIPLEMTGKNLVSLQ